MPEQVHGSSSGGDQALGCASYPTVRSSPLRSKGKPWPFGAIPVTWQLRGSCPASCWLLMAQRSPVWWYLGHVGVLQGTGRQRESHRLFLALLLKNIFNQGWKATSEFPVTPVPPDTLCWELHPCSAPGEDLWLHAGRAPACCGDNMAGSPAPRWEPCWGAWAGAGSAKPTVRGEAGLPSALLGSLPAFGTKAGAFPRPSADAWKAAGCQHLFGRAAVVQAPGDALAAACRAHGEVSRGFSRSMMPPKGRGFPNPSAPFPSCSWLSWRTTQTPSTRRRWLVARQGWRR